MLKIILLAAILGFFPSAFAEIATGKVTSIGCHNVDDTCYVSLENYPTSTVCNGSGSIRWDTTTSFGKRWYATLLAAKVSGLVVSLNIDGRCSGQNYPTFNFGSVQ